MIYKGFSCFPIQNERFPINRYMDCFPSEVKAVYMPILWQFFREPGMLSWPNIDLVIDAHLAKGRKVFFQPHLNFRVAKDEKYYQRQAVMIRNHMEAVWGEQMECKKLKVALSPILEASTSIKDAEFKRIIKATRKGWKRPIVISALGSPRSFGKFQEVHGKNPRYTKGPKQRIYNPDGTSVQFGQKENRDPKNEMTPLQYKNVVKKNKPRFHCVWTAEAQGLQNTDNSSSAPPVSERDFKISSPVISGTQQLLRAT